MPHNLLSDEGLIFFHGAEGVTAPQYQCLTDTPFRCLWALLTEPFSGPNRHYRVRPAFRSADREQHSAQSTRGLHLLPCCFHAALRLSVLCSAGTPPVVRGLPARPSARAEKLSPASTTRIQLQWLHSRRKLYNICANNLPAIVTTTPFSLVKSNRPRRPG